MAKINITEETINATIQATAKAIAAELKKQGLIKKQSAAYEKTERLLYSYIDYKMAVKSKDCIEPVKISYVDLIERNLLRVKEDPYFNIIVYRYFEDKTIDDIAGILNLEPSTVNRNKTRLINKLKISFFPDEAIEELLF